MKPLYAWAHVYYNRRVAKARLRELLDERYWERYRIVRVKLISPATETT